MICNYQLKVNINIKMTLFKVDVNTLLWKIDRYHYDFCDFQLYFEGHCHGRQIN